MRHAGSAAAALGGGRRGRVQGICVRVFRVLWVLAWGWAWQLGLACVGRLLGGSCVLAGTNLAPYWDSVAQWVCLDVQLANQWHECLALLGALQASMAAEAAELAAASFGEVMLHTVGRVYQAQVRQETPGPWHKPWADAPFSLTQSAPVGVPAAAAP